jgi:transcription initiation factor IIE alpha subunit
MRKIKYSDKAKCPKCGGMLSYDATITEKLPLGFGFAPGSSKFQVDILVSKGWRGECMECGEKVFAVESQRHVTRHPRNINRKISPILQEATA